MPQHMYINLDGGDLPLHLLPPGAGPESIVPLGSDEVELVMLDKGMASGAPSVAFFAKLPGSDKVVMLEMSAKQLLNASAAVRGRMVQKGDIRDTVNPAIAFMPDREAKVIRFSTETPLSSWFYTKEHASKFWRLLKDFCEEIS